METQAATPATIKQLAKEINDTVECLTQEMKRALIIIQKEEIKEIRLLCHKEHHTNNGDWYTLQWYPKKTFTGHEIGLHGFSEATIKETIKAFRNAGWQIKNCGKFCNSGGGSFEITMSE